MRLAALLAATLASAATCGAEGATPGVLRIGTPGDYAPYALHDAAANNWRGSDIALARGLAAHLGLRPQFISTSWSTLVADAKAGRFDIAVGGISITPERQREVGFSRSIASDRKLPVVRCGEERLYDTKAEINRSQVRLIVNAGGTNERFARATFPAATLTVHNDNRTVFDEIRAGRADVMVTDSVEGRLQQRTQQGLCVAKVSAIWSPAKKAVLVAAGAVTIKQVDAALAALGGKSRYQQELPDWEEYSWAGQARGTRLASLIDERLALVIEVARSKWNSKGPVEDPAREQQLLQSLRERAAPLGVSRETVDAFFGAQIEAAKVLQRELLARWQKQKQGPFTGVADLTRDIRPEIDRVTTQMLNELALNPGKDSRMPAASTISLVSPAALKTARQGHARPSGT